MPSTEVGLVNLFCWKRKIRKTFFRITCSNTSLFVNIKQNLDWARADCVPAWNFRICTEKIHVLTIKTLLPNYVAFWVTSGTPELKIRSMQIFFSHFEESRVFCFVSSWRAPNPTRALQTHDNGLQRALVISYKELLGDRRPLFQKFSI